MHCEQPTKQFIVIDHQFWPPRTGPGVDEIPAGYWSMRGPDMYEDDHVWWICQSLTVPYNG
jgi:hypothetical protein